MTKYEVKDKLSEYYEIKKSGKVDILKSRLDRLATLDEDAEVKVRIDELKQAYTKAVLESDNALAQALLLINLLDNKDRDADVLRKYHIEGMSEKAIARQLCLKTDYIRTKRWRAYERILKKMAGN